MLVWLLLCYISESVWFVYLEIWIDEFDLFLCWVLELEYYFKGENYCVSFCFLVFVYSDIFLI